MTTGSVVTLTNTNTTNKIDIAVDTAFAYGTTHATGTLGLSAASRRTRPRRRSASPTVTPARSKA